MFQPGLYAHVSSNDQQTLSMQSHAHAEVSRLARLRPPARYTDACLAPIP
jgi:hypothetical protein